MPPHTHIVNKHWSLNMSRLWNASTRVAPPLGSWAVTGQTVPPDVDVPVKRSISDEECEANQGWALHTPNRAPRSPCLSELFCPNDTYHKLHSCSHIPTLPTSHDPMTLLTLATCLIQRYAERVQSTWRCCGGDLAITLLDSGVDWRIRCVGVIRVRD